MMKLWNTPDGTIVARIYESYIGVNGQERVGLVERSGRVHHFDRSEVRDLHWERDCQVIPGMGR